jgi:molecular chaperone DnaK
VPKTMTKQFGTYEEGQEQVDLRCMENTLSGVRELEISACKELGTAILSFAHALPRSSPIEITFDLGPDGLLKVHGRDLTTGHEIDTEFKTQSIMSREEVEESKSHNLALKVA